MKNKFITAAFFSALLLFSSNVKAANFIDNQTVDANKIWTIKFTNGVGFDNLTREGITVADSKGNKASIDIQLGQDDKTVTVKAPRGGYTLGESYILSIGSKAHSSNGKSLERGYNLHFSINNNDSVVTFKDKKLELSVRYKINKLTGDILKSDVEKITDLNIRSFNIKDISGIENFTNLQRLDLVNNEIRDISALKGLTNLHWIYLASNRISDISALKNLTNLQTLDLVSNDGISDINALKNLTNLRMLNLNTNLISDISVLKGLTNLQTLDLSYNEISDISALKTLTNLKTLNLNNNQLISDDDKKSLKDSLPKCDISY